MSFTERFKAPTEVVQEYKKKVQYTNAGSERPKRGHLYFEFNFDTGELIVIPLNLEDARIVNTPLKLMQKAAPGFPIEQKTKRFTIEKKPNCYYFSALNFNNAFKKLSKLLPGITFDKIPENKQEK
jgi:hypothetical protein